MNPLAAPTVEMVLDQIDDATIAPLVAMIGTFAARLDEIEESVTGIQKHAPSKKDILDAAPADLAQEYARKQQELRDFYREIHFIVTGEREDSDMEALVAEAKGIHLQCLRLCKTLEETFQLDGIVNAVYNVIAKPEGAGIRKQYRGYGGYVEKD